MLLKKPLMGFNTWNTFGYEPNEKIVLDTVDAFVEKGYKDAGYEYIIIDDCWSEHKRDENGRLVANKEKFPHGMKYIADYVHSKGLKFGMYSDAGFFTCASFPGSYGYEMIDAETFAEWGVDYLKYDFGFFPSSAQAENAYLTMAQALRHSGRDIVFAACNWGEREPKNWMRSRGAHTYRSTHDINDSPESYAKILESQLDQLEGSTFDCFNDMDMLTVGMYGNGMVGKNGMTYQHYVYHFLGWAFCGSPLIIGADVTKIDPECEKLLLNKDIIAINQDEDCRPPFRIANYYGRAHVMARLLANGDVAILCVDFHPVENGTTSDRLPVSFDDLGIRSNQGYGFEVTNVYTGENLGVLVGGFSPELDRGEVRLYRLKLKKI